MKLAADIRLERLKQEFLALTEIARVLTATRNLSEQLAASLQTTITAIEPAEAGVILLWEPASRLYQPRAAYGEYHESSTALGIRAEDPLIDLVFKTEKARLLSSPADLSVARQTLQPTTGETAARDATPAGQPTGVLAAPLAAGDKRAGILVVESFQEQQTFNQDDADFLSTVASLLAPVIEQARSEEKSARPDKPAFHLTSLAELAHEMRMPLTAIKGYATALLLDEVEWSSHKREVFLRQIEAECDLLEAMLQNLFDAASAAETRVSLSLQWVNLPRLARETAAEIKRRSKRHHLIVDFPADFPSVQADPGRIKQVFRNLLDNAMKYSPGGGLIVIRGETRPTDVVVSISDQGIGISPEELSILFEKYQRAPVAPDHQIPGTGLGLPIVRTAIEAHHGHIWAESQPGQGTTFSFSLPLTRATAKEEG